MEWLSNVEVWDENVWSLDGIQAFPKVDSITLVDTNVSDLSPIANLHNIKWVDIENGCVTDLSPLKNLKNINELICKNLNLEDYSVIGQLENLEYLELEKCNIKDISMFKNLKKLKAIYLRDNYIENIEALGELKQLRVIQLENNEIGDISPLLNLPSENEYKGEYDSVFSQKELYLEDNLIDESDSSKSGKIINKLEEKGFRVSCDEYKKDIHPIKVNGNIEKRKDNSYVAVYTDREFRVNYKIQGNYLTFSVDGLMEDRDDSSFYLFEDDDPIYYFEMKDDSTLKGDVNKDGKTDIADLSMAANYYNKNSKDSNTWNINNDCRKDGRIDIYDLAIISSEM